MLVFLVERGGLVDVVENTVDADAGEAGLLPFGELLAIFALPAADHRGEQIMTRAFGQSHRPVDHLADGLCADRKPGDGGIRHADAGPQQPHILIDFGDGATVERGLRLVVFCSIEIAGLKPSICSTSGFCIISRN